MSEFCSICINPRDPKIIHPVMGRPLQFYETDQGSICEICHEVFYSGTFPSRVAFDQEFNAFLNTHSRVLFAYSGGLDSTVVLIKLLEECQKRNIELISFTVETGVKGSIAAGNIHNVLQQLGIIENHITIDIRNVIQEDPRIVAAVGKPMSTFDVYRTCYKKEILPCGKICNVMMDAAYLRIMNELGFSVLVTGGDTPKLNSSGLYSLFWRKPSDIVILRGGYAFALSKDANLDFIDTHSIRWQHPQCGGYDTDCLAPGTFFSEQLRGKAVQIPKEVIKKFPIILEYLSERVRFGVINRDEGMRRIGLVDIGSDSSVNEFKNLVMRE